MKIAIQGELGSFSHAAALQFDPQAEVQQCTQAADAFRKLQWGEAEAIALPVENTLAGSVVEHYDLLWEHPTHIERERVLPIRHTLIGMPGSTIESIHRVYSHPVALAQCRQFLAAHPQLEAVPFYDTAGAVKQVMEMRDRHSGGIASALSAAIYGGEVLVSNIEDNPENYTRFLLLRRGPSQQAPVGRHKLSVAFELEHRQGTLAEALAGLSEAGGDITKLQARPIHGQPWHYIFYVDCLAASAGASDAILASLQGRSVRLKNLGRYPVVDENAQAETGEG
jgi:prephenate dehydratase